MDSINVKIETLDDFNKLCRLLSKRDENIDAVKGKHVVNAKSILGLLSLGSGVITLEIEDGEYNKVEELKHSIGMTLGYM